jgi:serine/threonine-protein kinase
VTDVTASVLGDALRDRYRLERELGRGGMATVYLAQDLKHQRHVALKVLRPELSAVLGAERFLREIQLTAGLQHPHILPLLDSGEAAGFLYYVMPFVEGESLRQRLQREGQLPIVDALHITRGVASALDYAHGRGVIHRDVKPENILLYQGEPMVADFGIALAAATAGRERLTETGLSLGTPSYMSPEQASASSKVDARSDQYSLACVVFEMLAGEPPYTGPTAQAVIAKRFSEPVPHLSTVRQVSPAVEGAVTRALAKAPADRFPTVLEFTAALERTAVRRPVSRRVAALAGGIGTLTVIGVLGFFLRPAHPVRPLSSRQLTFTGMAKAPALSPDGKSVAYVSGNRALLVQHVDGSEPTILVPPTRWADVPRWTADGQAVVATLMRDSSELAATWSVASGGGPARKVLEEMVPIDTGEDSLLARIPHGKHYIEVVNWQSGKTERMVPLPDSVGGSGYNGVAWSPDRRWFAFEDRSRVWVIPAAGGQPVAIARGWNPRWNAASDGLYYLSGPPGEEVLLKVRLETRSSGLVGTPRRLASLPGAGTFDIQGDRLAYTRTSNSRQVRVLELGGTPRRVTGDRQITSGTAPATGVTISADGRWVAYSQARGGEEHVYIAPFEGGSTRRVTATKASESSPSFAPDGSRLSYEVRDSSGAALMVVDLRSGASQRVGSLPTRGGSWWSADGKSLIYLTADQRHAAVVDVGRQTERVLALTDSTGSAYGAIILDPAGRIAVASTLHRWSDWGEMWTTPVDSAQWTRMDGPFGESDPVAWTPDGWIYMVNHRVFVTDYGALRRELWRAHGVRAPAELVIVLPEGCEETDVSADASRIVCLMRRDESDIYLATDFDPELD